MKKLLKKRLTEIENHFATVPIHFTVVKAAFEEFRRSGELPEDQRLAYAVVKRARAGYDCVYDEHGRFDWAASIQAGLKVKPRPNDALMDELFDEAVWADGFVRTAARMVLRGFAAAGLDPSEPQLADKGIEIPDFGGVGIHLLGLPDRLAKPPYEEQARRLFTRYETIRERVPQGDRRWMDEFGKANGAFHEFGELPDDDLLRDVVLADAEFRTLIRHAAGEDVRELMAAFDRAARAEPDDRDGAVADLVALASAGRLLPADAE